MCWRRLLEVIAALAIGAVCLVAWSSPSSAESSPATSGQLRDATGQLLLPVHGLTDSLGLGPVVGPLVDEVVDLTLTTLDATLAPTVDGAVGTITSPSGSSPGLPSPPTMPDPGQLQVPALVLPGSGVSAVPAGVAPSGGGVETAASTPAGPSTPNSSFALSSRRSGGETVTAIDSLAAPAADGDSSSPLSDLPLLPALVGIGSGVVSLASGAGSFELALMAILAGVVVATTPAWRRLPLRGLLAPPAMSYAIASRPG